MPPLDVLAADASTAARLLARRLAPSRRYFTALSRWRDDAAARFSLMIDSVMLLPITCAAISSPLAASRRHFAISSRLRGCRRQPFCSSVIAITRRRRAARIIYRATSLFTGRCYWFNATCHASARPCRHPRLHAHNGRRLAAPHRDEVEYATILERSGAGDSARHTMKMPMPAAQVDSPSRLRLAIAVRGNAGHVAVAHLGILGSPHAGGFRHTPDFQPERFRRRLVSVVARRRFRWR